MAIEKEIDHLAWAHPLVSTWFRSRFSQVTEPQIYGWPHIHAGRPVLISAPTGSGKTFAAFLVCIDALVRQAQAGTLENRTEVLYVSPLRALSNDIQKNLETPLTQIQELAQKQGLSMQTINAAVRTGDTQPDERRSQVKRPPHILVTTPESLYILLTAEKSRQSLRHVKTVIVDEIHAVCDDKRGAHLALSLERLDDLADVKPTRIGLSATQKPLGEVAAYLVGSSAPMPEIVNVGHSRPLDLAVEVPPMPLEAVASNEMWDEIYERLAKLAQSHRSTLVFVNTRKLSERVAHRLAERLGEGVVAAHHGSLSRKIRLNVEKRLKAGEIKMLVATASLELGIDIGSVDLVCQIGSPRSIAAALQRIGRAGHWLGAIPKGRLFATTRDELVECAAIVKAIRSGELDKLIIPDQPLDVLAQQMVAACATREWDEEELFDTMRRAYPYRCLEREKFDELVQMLAEGFAGRRGRFAAYVHHDPVNHKLKGRRNARLSAITSGGAIPETGLYTVVAEPEGKTIGTLDEDFSVESSRGDIILLGSASWRIKRVENRSGRVIVEDAHGAPPTVPFWRGEAPARTVELSQAVADVREQVDKLLPGLTEGPMLPDELVAQLEQTCGVDRAGAEQLVDYVREGKKVLGVVPSKEVVVAERFFDETGAMQLVLHSPFGGRINKAWGLALRKRFCRSFNYELQAAATDNGINISLLEQHSFPLSDVFQFLHPETVEEVLVQASLPLPIFETRWRWTANRALAVLRFSGGRKVPPNFQRMRAQDLLASIFPQAAACQDNIEGDLELPDHPLVNETMHDVLTEAMDVDGLKEVLEKIASGQIKCLAVDTPVPSVFSHEILNANPYAYLDDAPLEERRARAVQMRRILPESMVQEVGRLDPEAIRQVEDEAWPDIRDADELADLISSVVLLPEDFRWKRNEAAVWTDLFEQLERSGRVVTLSISGRRWWSPAPVEGSSGRVKRVGPAHIKVALTGDNLEAKNEIDQQEVVNEAIGGWLPYLGPFTAQELAGSLSLTKRQVEIALLNLESKGLVLRGQFTRIIANTSDPGQAQWCERRLLARIHRMTLGELRKQIEPVTAAQFYRWLLEWQHVAPGTQVQGERGTLEILSQLAGYEAPASAWETEILSRRIANYKMDYLDRLCMTGAVGWGRLSPHPAFEKEGLINNNRRVIPTGAAPIAFYLRDEADWMTRKLKFEEAQLEIVLSHAAARVFAFLKARGASFFSDIARVDGLLKSEVESALWELVTAGLVTADGYDNLRSLIDAKRRSGQGRGRYSRPRHSAGRWSILFPFEDNDRTRVAQGACQLLLARYGVVFRDLIAREDNMPSWRELLVSFRRMEDRGDVRGGRFVDGFVGEQFALPLAVESLRASRKKELPPSVVRVSAADPLNLSGILIPGEKIASISSRFITIHDGARVAADQ